LHKQAVHGDAPPPSKPLSSTAEKARYNAWVSKRGLQPPDVAMKRYVMECERQVRVYGTTTTTESLQQEQQQQDTTTTLNSSSSSVVVIPRGLAAIPLLCAAAAESRVAYLHRLSHTACTSGWWSRQETLLCGNDNYSVESILLYTASTLESVSLKASSSLLFLPPTVLQSLLWPLHNVLLSTWMLYILVATFLASTWSLAQTVLFGAQRTGITMKASWRNELIPCADAAATLTEAHQPLSVRVVGLLLLPIVYDKQVTTSLYRAISGGNITQTASSYGILLASSLHVVVLASLWWYWFFVVPSCGFAVFCIAGLSGWCFAIIQTAAL